MKLIKCRKCGRHFRATDNDYCLSKCTGCGSTDLEETIYNPNGSDINWEERRYEIAKCAMQGFVANSSVSEYVTPQSIAEWAVEYADALIAELKKKR